MNRIVYDYYAIFRTEERIPPAGGLICSEVTNGPVRTVLWDHVDQRWTFDGDVGARFLYDDNYQDRVTSISRAEAERIAREDLGTTLPSEEELHRICEAGEAALTVRPDPPDPITSP